MKALVEMEGSGLVAMLEGDKYEDLARMYALLKRVVDGGLALMRQVSGRGGPAVCGQRARGHLLLGLHALCARAACHTHRTPRAHPGD